MYPLDSKVDEKKEVGSPGIEVAFAHVSDLWPLYVEVTLQPKTS